MATSRSVAKTVPTPSTRLSVPSIAEKFLQYRKLHFGRWGAIQPFIRSRTKSAHCLLLCRQLAVKEHGPWASELIDILERLGPRQRKSLARHVSGLRPTARTLALARSVINDLSQLVSDLASLELIYTKENAAAAKPLRDLPEVQATLVSLYMSRIVVTVSRLLDPSISAGRATASLESLSSSLHRDGFRVLASEINTRLGRRGRKKNKGRRAGSASGVRLQSRAIILLRNKRIAHSDIKVATGRVKLAPVTFAMLKAATHEIASIMNHYELWMNVTSVKYQHLLDGARPMRTLIRSLAK